MGRGLVGGRLPESRVPNFSPLATPVTANSAEADSDVEAMLRVKTGDEAAFSYLVQKYRRPMVGFTAPLRLLNTAWIYDEVNKILFSSDMFTHVWSDKIEGPWLMEGDDGVTSNAFVRSFLLGTGFWWLEGARSDPLRKGVRRVFETYDIEMICPGYGAMLKGRELVKKQFDVLDAVLADLDRTKVQGRYIAREPARRISEGAP